MYHDQHIYLCSCNPKSVVNVFKSTLLCTHKKKKNLSQKIYWLITSYLAM